MLKTRSFVFATLLQFLILLACAGTSGGGLSVSVNLDQTVRKDVPSVFFGFNIEWLPFQMGYLRDGAIRPEVVDWLSPFKGAMYRYPGGAKANGFIWSKSIGPASARALQVTENGQKDPALFGMDEFLTFVQQVGGVPVVVANLFGQKGQPWSELSLVELNRNWVVHANKNSSTSVGKGLYTPCEVGSPCRVTWWELGNELDWKGHRWSVEQIVDRARKIGAALKEADSSVKLVAFTRTGGFLPDGNKDMSAGEFNRTVAERFKDLVDAYSTHIYYEGRSIPEVLDYMQQLRSQVQAGAGKPRRVFVTEHAKWPNKPLIGDWQTTWSKTGNLGGAIATADFMLGLMPMPEVDVALWHQLGARGPWQLFYLSKKDDHLWPNVVYWALRVLRQGVLDDVLETKTSSDSSVWPGYAVRSVFMRKSDGSRYSLMSVNRSGKEQKTRLDIPKWAGRSFNVRHYYITGNSKDDANLEGEENRVVMQDRSMVIRFDAKGQATISLPAFSVSSFLFEPTVGK